MHTRIAASLLTAGLLITGIASAQTPPNPTQQQILPRESSTPLFRITVVGRTTPAVNYRPRKGATKVDLVGTPLLPRAKGTASVEGEKGYMAIDARFDNLEPATKFGAEYLTYVLWAVTPEGRATNLGEVQVDDKDARIKVTTELQAFGLILTAEPYFAVTQPSDVVVMENVLRSATIGTSEIIQAKYDLLNRGSYLMRQDAGQLKLKPLEPGAPLDLAEARNAVALARFAAADKYALDTFTKAASLLNDAELARERKLGANAIMMPARQAAQTAEDARLIALKKQEEEYVSAQQQSADDARLLAERNSAAADRARLAAEAERLAAERAKASADAARATSDAARLAADTARLSAEATTRNAQALIAQADREKAELRARLREQLNLVLETRESARGLIVNLSDVLFSTGSTILTPGAREKLSKISGILVSHQGLHVEIEGHTDSVGTDIFNQRLSEGRAGSVRDYLVARGIASNTVGTSGFGESKPVATNDTAEGKQQNRRVELIVSGDPIGAAR